MTGPLALSAEEARVAGALAEKQLTTPQYYPLTMNALVAACNQSNNRDPVVSYGAATVEAAVASLREKGLARLVHPGGGSRVAKYRHSVDESLGLDRCELALVCVLLLRGPQTLNELRTRTERMADFDGVDDVARDLDRLAAREEPLAVRLERQPGQKEQRYATTLVPVAAPAGAVPAGAGPAGGGAGRGAGGGRSGGPPVVPGTTISEPRLGPLGDDALTDEQRELLAGTGAVGMHLFRTLVRHPGLFRRWAPFGGKLLAGGALPPRLRELAILRTAYLVGAAYEWGHHVGIGRQAGLSAEELDEVTRGAGGGGWSDVEAAVLEACDDLHERGVIGDASWRVLRGALDDKQLVELPLLVGHYRMLAGAIASLGVEPEPGTPPFPAGDAAG